MPSRNVLHALGGMGLRLAVIAVRVEAVRHIIFYYSTLQNLKLTLQTRFLTHMKVITHSIEI